MTQERATPPPVPPPPELVRGTLIDGRYRLKDRIGEGGMGAVFTADQVRMERTVVVKVLKPDLCRDDEQVQRFKREASLASKLTHPNSVVTHDFGFAGGVPYIVMEHLIGAPLCDILHQRRRLPLNEAVHLMTQVCASLNEAHEKGMVHRDLKPENIFVLSDPSRPNFVKVLDFGIAKLVHDHPDAKSSNLTKGDMIFGTPQYMAPEQIRGKPVDARIDVYAVGVMLYQCVVGKLPYDSHVVVDILTQHLTQPLPELTLRDELDLSDDVVASFNQLIRRTMAKNPNERISDMPTLISELNALNALFTRPFSPLDLPAPAETAPAPAAPAAGGGALRRAPLALLLGAALAAAAFFTPHLAPGGQGWGLWAQGRWAALTAPALEGGEGGAQGSAQGG
ncbi:MAG: serine/threonine protein kinase, partial [Deltaproteobacteria bacterium]|nr:serine/threonine protein kinase [Deltaproteobacteria bacterium]